jgi:copper homeostasis protein CutC
MLHSGRTILVLPGSGINADNVGGMLDEVAAVREVHMTGSSTVVLPSAGSPAGQRRKELGFGADEIWTVDREKVAAVWTAMKVRYGL